jgi:hypothetical protein
VRPDVSGGDRIYADERIRWAYVTTGWVRRRRGEGREGVLTEDCVDDVVCSNEGAVEVFGERDGEVLELRY